MGLTRRGRLQIGACFFVCVLLAVMIQPAGSGAAPAPGPIHAIRFDPGYYYNTGVAVNMLVDRLVTHWESQGVNLIYYYAYSFAYGARYRTRYEFNREEDFGRLDLLRRLTEAAHRRDLKVIAWVYVLRHKGAWDANPSWRSLTADGQPYAEGFDQYFLSPHQPDAVQWWLGFVDDLLRANPGIDGVDLVEPVVNWWGNAADLSIAARGAFARAYPGAAVGGTAWQEFRANALSAVLEASAGIVKRYGKELHVTMTVPARADGSLMALSVLRQNTGFDLERLLQRARPDYVDVELIYQQWVAEHHAPQVFTPEWTARAAAGARALLRGRAQLIVHVELSEFGGVVPSVGEFSRVLRALQREGFGAMDLYATHLLDATGAWEVVRQAFTSSPAASAFGRY